MYREAMVYKRLVVLINDEPHYLVSFRDEHGKTVDVDLNEISNQEVAKIVFQEVQEQQREDMRQYRSDFKHTEHLQLNPGEIDERSFHKAETVEDTLLRSELGQEMAEAVKMLPELQCRRFLMYHIDELSENEIAVIEGCSQPAVHYSIKAAQSFLKKVLKKYLAETY